MLLKSLVLQLGGACLLALSLAAASAPAVAAETKAGAARTAALLVTFGSSHAGAAAGLAQVEADLKAARPELSVRWAYTSEKVRARLAKQGQKVLSPAEALAALRAEGFKRVAVQSLHVIAGAEFHELAAETRAFAAANPGLRVALGRPLIGDNDDLLALTGALLAEAGPPRPGLALVWVGHGSHHPAGLTYPALAWALARAQPNAFLGTVEGKPDFDDVMAGIQAAGLKEARLMPLLTVIGEHSKEDIAGDAADSWKSRLTAAGIAVTPALRAISEIKAVRDIWLGHLGLALKDLEGKPAKAKKH
ncbi:MAG: sirohydrochlorin cobaltochelatase [Thermodesulfobacteriota bacterium]